MGATEQPSLAPGSQQSWGRSNGSVTPHGIGTGDDGTENKTGTMGNNGPWSSVSYQCGHFSIEECIPVGCVPPAHWPHLVVPGARQGMLGYTPSPSVDRILDTRLWKHYLPATTVAGGKYTRIHWSRSRSHCRAVWIYHNLRPNWCDGTFTLNESERGFYNTLPTLNIKNTSNFFPKNLTESDVTFTQCTIA